MANPAAFVRAHRITVRPVNEPAEIVPLVDAAKANAIAEAQWHTFPDIEIVRDQQRLPPGRLQHEALVA